MIAPLISTWYLYYLLGSNQFRIIVKSFRENIYLSRFLTMIAHLVLAITLLISRDENVRACLPLEHSRSDFDRKDVELATGIWLFLKFE